MGFLGSLVNLAAEVVTTPIAIVKDVVNLGDIITNEKKSAIAQKLSNIADKTSETIDKLI